MANIEANFNDPNHRQNITTSNFQIFHNTGFQNVNNHPADNRNHSYQNFWTSWLVTNYSSEKSSTIVHNWISITSTANPTTLSSSFPMLHISPLPQSRLDLVPTIECMVKKMCLLIPCVEVKKLRNIHELLQIMLKLNS